MARAGGAGSAHLSGIHLSEQNAPDPRSQATPPPPSVHDVRDRDVRVRLHVAYGQYGLVRFNPPGSPGASACLGRTRFDPPDSPDASHCASERLVHTRYPHTLARALCQPPFGRLGPQSACGARHKGGDPLAPCPTRKAGSKSPPATACAAGGRSTLFVTTDASAHRSLYAWSAHAGSSPLSAPFGRFGPQAARGARYEREDPIKPHPATACAAGGRTEHALR